MSDHYLVHGANALKGAIRYVESSGPPTAARYDPRSVAVFLNSACSTLRMLREDRETLDLLSRTTGEAAETVRTESREFIAEFVKADRALLVAAGMDRKVASYLFKDAERSLRVLSSEPSIEDANWRHRVSELCEEVCGEAKSMNDALSREKLLRRSLNVIGGGAIVVTNVAADSFLGGIASALSQAYGGYIAGMEYHR